ncbi:hypothetical protein BD289DRAFT_483594 [Coniella lustricola]|uniref:Uncharacterized protein n=1 Tax=Coniella lustricola TaxID=2025994 RepID=A0A2T3A510_9PEZI|nr:hypothetical protein BD289DRAFT_483594 [Coniella lustricola]
MSSQQASRDHSWSSTTSHYQQYMVVIPIEDEDLTFGGKSLSTWYEEDHRQYSDESLDSPDERGLRSDTRKQ